MTGHVYEFAADGRADALEPTPVLSIDLHYRKGEVIAWAPTVPDTGTNPWNAWNDAGERGPNVVRERLGAAITAPQPQISDLVLNDNGDLVLAFRDRFGDQTGNRLIDITGREDPLFEGTSGDILLACVDPSAGGRWRLEHNGKCGSRTGVGAGNGEGPGDGTAAGSGESSTGATPIPTFTPKLLRALSFDAPARAKSSARCTRRRR